MTSHRRASPSGRGWTAAACAQAHILASPRGAYATPAGAVHLSICRLRFGCLCVLCASSFLSFPLRASPLRAAADRPHDMGAPERPAHDALASDTLLCASRSERAHARRGAVPSTHRTTICDPRRLAACVRKYARTLARLLAWFTRACQRASRYLAFARASTLSCMCVPRRAPRTAGRCTGESPACRARAPSTPRRHARPMTQPHGSARRPSAVAGRRHRAPFCGCALGALAAPGGARCQPEAVRRARRRVSASLCECDLQRAALSATRQIRVSAGVLATSDQQSVSGR